LVATKKVVISMKGSKDALAAPKGYQGFAGAVEGTEKLGRAAPAAAAVLAVDQS
jgi:hypothetical protein